MDECVTLSIVEHGKLDGMVGCVADVACAL